LCEIVGDSCRDDHPPVETWGFLNQQFLKNICIEEDGEMPRQSAERQSAK
jgi:hypothetical protein